MPTEQEDDPLTHARKQLVRLAERSDIADVVVRRAHLRLVLDAISRLEANQTWRPISEAPQQTRLWVGCARFDGLFADAYDRPSVGWCHAHEGAGPEKKLSWTPLTSPTSPSANRR